MVQGLILNVCSPLYVMLHSLPEVLVYTMLTQPLAFISG